MSKYPHFPEALSCPVPIMDHKTIQLAHGAGGRLSEKLIENLFLPRFGNETLNKLEDHGTISIPSGRLAMSTDSFVVDPIFFPGGNIGDLAINGTVNDVAMSGAQPTHISVAFILEEGLPIEELHAILCSMEEAANSAEVQIITADTKVVNKGHGDKLFINTTGIGMIPEGIHISAGNLQPGDKILLSGTLADHGMAVMTSREGLSFQSQVKSDTAALNDLVARMIEASPRIHALRDPTRGGLATTLNEFAPASQIGIRLDDGTIPVTAEVSGACEVLGIDPLYVANEGKLVAAVPGDDANRVLKTMQSHPLGKESAIIGEVVNDHAGTVVMTTGLGAERIIDMPVGEQLPRIC